MGKRRRRGYALVMAVVALLLLTAGVILWPGARAVADVGCAHRLCRYTVDGGGGTFSTGGGYSLGGTIGQADAGLLIGGEFSLGGGFWGGGALTTAGYEMYLPVVLRDT